MSFGRSTQVIREVSAPPPPVPEASGASPASPPTKAAAQPLDVAASTSVSKNSASRPQNATGENREGGRSAVSGARSLVNTSTEGLTRKADTRKRSLLGGA